MFCVFLGEASAKLKRGSDSGASQRLAATHFLKAMDHATSFVIGGLNTFSGVGSVPVLKQSEMRNVTDRRRPCPFPVPAHIKQLRSCTYNIDSKVATHDVQMTKRGGACITFSL